MILKDVFCTCRNLTKSRNGRLSAKGIARVAIPVRNNITNIRINFLFPKTIILYEIRIKRKLTDSIKKF